MGIAALVLGVLGLLVCWIPFCSFFAFIPCVIGLILGIVDVVLKSKKQLPKGIGIAGIVLNVISLIVIVIWTVVISAGIKEAGGLEAVQAEIQRQQQIQLQQQDGQVPPAEDGVVVEQEEVVIQPAQ